MRSQGTDESPGFYYAGYGIMLLPPLGIIESYGGRTSEYYNAFGLYLAGITIPTSLSSNDQDGSFDLVWSGLNCIFFLASLSTYVVVLPGHSCLYHHQVGRLTMLCNIETWRTSSYTVPWRSVTSSTQHQNLQWQMATFPRGRSWPGPPELVEQSQLYLATIFCIRASASMYLLFQYPWARFTASKQKLSPRNNLKHRFSSCASGIPPRA